MYTTKLVSIAKASNGYVVECRVPIKPKEKEKEKGIISEYPGSCEKQYIAKDMAEVAALVTKIMPLLDDKFTSEDEFDAAFDKAAA